MLFKIVFICDESDKFLREITIDSDATFLDLNKAILDSCKYEDNQITSFYTCNDEWEQELQVTREDMGTSAADEDIYIMEKTRLSELIKDEDQHLIYVFDPFSERVFYMKVSEIVTGKSLKKAICSRSEGKAPIQIQKIDDDLSATIAKDTPLVDDDNAYYGSDDFDQEEMDPEGFEIEDH